MRSAACTAENSAVRQEIFDDVVAVGLEHDAGAAVLADLLLGALDHAVAFAGHGRFHPAAGRDLEALLGARLGLDLGHFALLQVRHRTQAKGPVPPENARMSVLIGSASPPRQPSSAGRRKAGFMAEDRRNYNHGE